MSKIRVGIRSLIVYLLIFSFVISLTRNANDGDWNDYRFLLLSPVNTFLKAKQKDSRK